jgi:hypothetical protein
MHLCCLHAALHSLLPHDFIHRDRDRDRDIDRDIDMDMDMDMDIDIDMDMDMDVDTLPSMHRLVRIHVSYVYMYLSMYTCMRLCIIVGVYVYDQTRP